MTGQPYYYKIIIEKSSDTGMRNKKKQTIIILSFALSIFVFALGISYAYFSVTVRGNDTASNMVTEMATLKLTYRDTNIINTGNILPGWEGTKTFSVENTGSEAISYNIKLVDVINEFLNDELVYVIESTNGGGITSETIMPTIDGYLIRNISIAKDEIQQYTVKILFKETGEDQSSNMNKAFTGKIEIDTNDQRAYWYESCAINPESIGCKILSDNEEEETLRSEAADTTKTAYAANEYGLFKTEANNTDIYYYRGGDHCENASGVMQNYTTSSACTAAGHQWKTLNNNIIYGGKCWQIIRTNEDGSIRVIYNGLPTSGQCTATGDDAQAGKSQFNTETRTINGTTYVIARDVSAVGYTFGSPEGSTYTEHRGTKLIENRTILDTYTVGTGKVLDTTTGLYTLTGTKLASDAAVTATTLKSQYKYICFNIIETSCNYVYEVAEDATVTPSGTNYIVSATYRISANWSQSEAKATADEEDSTMKTYLENWYTTNLTAVDADITDAGYCNDRTLYVDTLGYGSNAYYRVFERTSILKTPSYECPNTTRDLYTVSAENGNGHADKKIGLITADELIYAGSLAWTTEAKNTYLYTESGYWTISSARFLINKSWAQAWNVFYGGHFGDTDIAANLGVRPVISLNTSKVITGGTGSKTSPYVIN